jgi:hypothetical protein
MRFSVITGGDEAQRFYDAGERARGGAAVDVGDLRASRLHRFAALFVFYGAVHGLDHDLKLGEPRAGVLRLSPFVWTGKNFSKGAAIFDKSTPRFL